MAGKSGSKNTDEELSAPVVKAIADLAGVDQGSVASLLDTHLDVDVSSRAVPGDSPDPAAYTGDRAARLDNLDKAISALNDLSQSDILSDGTPFAGSNLDAAVSTRAVPGDSVDWSSKTYQSILSAGGSTVSVSGSGFLLGVSLSGTCTGSAPTIWPNIRIDQDDQSYRNGGINALNSANTGQIISSGASMIWRFESELKLEPSISDVDGAIVRGAYVLD